MVCLYRVRFFIYLFFFPKVLQRRNLENCLKLKDYIFQREFYCRSGLLCVTMDMPEKWQLSSPFYYNYFKDVSGVVNVFVFLSSLDWLGLWVFCGCFFLFCFVFVLFLKKEALWIRKYSGYMTLVALIMALSQTTYSWFLLRVIIVNIALMSIKATFSRAYKKVDGIHLPGNPFLFLI